VQLPPGRQMSPAAAGARAPASSVRLEIAAVGLLSAYALAARLFIAIQLPPWQGPDEPKHFEYIRLLIDKRDQLWAEHRLLTVDDASPALEQQVIQSMARNHFWVYVTQSTPDRLPATFFELWQGKGTELHRPSLYYVLPALAVAPVVSRPIEQQLLTVRIASAILNALAVPLAYAAARAVRPHDPFIRVVAAAFTAALPMNVFVGGIANVDNLAILVGGLLALGLAGGLSVARSRGFWGLIMGAVVLGLATKREFVGVLPGLLFACLACAMRQRAVLAATFNRRTIIAGTGAIALAIALGVMSGRLSRVTTVFSDYALNEPNQITRLLDRTVSPSEVLSLLPVEWDAFYSSFWGRFGWFTTPLSPEVYAVLNVVSVMVVIGLPIALVASWKSQADDPHLVTICIYGIFAVTMTLLGFGIALSYFSPSEVPQGRQIFGVLVPIAILLAIGARAWLPASRFGNWLPAAVATLLLVLLDVTAYFQSYAPHFVGRTLPQ
jgi:hypothetical protein